MKELMTDTWYTFSKYYRVSKIELEFSLAKTKRICKEHDWLRYIRVFKDQSSSEPLKEILTWHH